MTEDEKMEVYNRGIAEGVKHQAPSPQTVEEINELKEEWHEFKSRALWLLIGGLVAMVGYGSWVGVVQSEVSYNRAQLSSLDGKHAQIETRLGKVEITNSEIKSRLNSIDTTLQEIKLAIKELR
jgi:hypothetical protein